MSHYNNRKSRRKPYVATVQYRSSVIERGEEKKVDDESLIVDISDDGVGMFVGHPFEPGNVLYFREAVRTSNSPRPAAIVRWTEEIFPTQYRVGCEFARETPG